MPEPAASFSQYEPMLLSTLLPSSVPVSAMFIYWANPMEETDKALVSVLASLSHLLIFITRTGNINFILHILTPLRKLYV